MISILLPSTYLENKNISITFSYWPLIFYLFRSIKYRIYLFIFKLPYDQSFVFFLANFNIYNKDYKVFYENKLRYPTNLY